MNKMEVEIYVEEKGEDYSLLIGDHFGNAMSFQSIKDFAYFLKVEKQKYNNEIHWTLIITDDIKTTKSFKKFDKELQLCTDIEHGSIQFSQMIEI